MSFCIPQGSKIPWTCSLPRAAAQIAATTELSLPPEMPRTASVLPSLLKNSLV